MDYLCRTWAEIDLNALVANYRAICRKTSRRVCLVVKADAYGHGAVQVAQTLQADGADFFAVSNILEAEELRSAGITGDILILGYTPAQLADRLAAGNIIQSVFSLDYAQALSAAARESGVTVPAHLKLDTGMGRIGFDCRTAECEGLQDAEKAMTCENLRFTGVFMHFAVADGDTDAECEFTRQQYGRFAAAVEALEKDGFRFAMKHCCNSAGMLTLPEQHLDAVRAGIILYGLSPSGCVEMDPALKPVMSLRSAVSMVKELDEGETVSYGRTYTAPSRRRIATVCAGYADGVPRLLSNCGEVLIRGQRAPIVGRVCMDQFCVDVTGIEGVAQGDVVTIFGDGLSVNEVAEKALTINYEIICGITKRVPRIYLGGEE